MSKELILLSLALALAVAAAIIDVRQRRIPNWLTYPAMAIGVVLRGVLFGWRGVTSGLAGWALLGGVMLLFYAVRAMGAGDVKLLAAIGALAGPRAGFGVLLATAICGGILAILYALYRGQMRATLKNLGSVMWFHARSGFRAHPELNLDNPATLRMPYGLAIAAGTLYACLTSWWS